MSLILAAIKGGNNNNIIWIDLLPTSHTYLLCQAKALAPPSYPLPLLKRVMFTFLLEVINSWGSCLDKFIKTLAPCWCHAMPAPAPSSLPAGPANPGPRQVLDVEAQHSGTVTPVTPMAVDPPPPSLHPAALSPLPGLAAAIFKPGASLASPQRGPEVAQAAKKHGLLPPICPLSPPPILYLSVSSVPSNWQDWITLRCCTCLLSGQVGPPYVQPEDL